MLAMTVLTTPSITQAATELFYVKNVGIYEAVGDKTVATIELQFVATSTELKVYKESIKLVSSLNVVADMSVQTYAGDATEYDNYFTIPAGKNAKITVMGIWNTKDMPKNGHIIAAYFNPSSPVEIGNAYKGIYSVESFTVTEKNIVGSSNKIVTINAKVKAQSKSGAKGNTVGTYYGTQGVTAIPAGANYVDRRMIEAVDYLGTKGSTTVTFISPSTKSDIVPITASGVVMNITSTFTIPANRKFYSTLNFNVKPAVSSDAICGRTVNTCIVGTPYSSTVSLLRNNWTCLGVGMGKTVECSSSGGGGSGMKKRVSAVFKSLGASIIGAFAK